MRIEETSVEGRDEILVPAELFHEFPVLEHDRDPFVLQIPIAHTLPPTHPSSMQITALQVQAAKKGLGGSVINGKFRE